MKQKHDPSLERMKFVSRLTWTSVQIRELHTFLLLGRTLRFRFSGEFQQWPCISYRVPHHYQVAATLLLVLVNGMTAPNQQHCQCIKYMMMVQQHVWAGKTIHQCQTCWYLLFGDKWSNEIGRRNETLKVFHIDISFIDNGFHQLGTATRLRLENPMLWGCAGLAWLGWELHKIPSWALSANKPSPLLSWLRAFRPGHGITKCRSLWKCCNNTRYSRMGRCCCWYSL